MNFPLSPRFQAVLFDMDGTLLDTLSDMQDAVNHILLEMVGRSAPSRKYAPSSAMAPRSLWSAPSPSPLRPNGFTRF